jgi:molybdopterin molybdotransferase
MISVEEALALVLAPLQSLPAETIALDRAFGRVLAQDAVARRTQPPCDMSAMDGWAVRQSDLRAPLTALGESAAGSAYSGTLAPGQAVRIFTGAPVPDGADTIILQEDADLEAGRLMVREAPPPGKHIRRAGLDFHQGAALLLAGRLLNPRDIALLGAMDIPWVSVRRRPRVAILATGDELVRPGEPVGPSQIIASNNLGIGGLVLGAGGDWIDLGIAPDRPDALALLAQGARGADLLVTIGGASVGDRDLVRATLEGQGMTLAFHKIAMRPGKPLMSGMIGSVPFLGLPGNPVSAMICAVLFLVPMVKRLLGLASTNQTIHAALSDPLWANDRRADFIRAALSRDDRGGWIATPFDIQDSAMLSTLSRADGLILRQPFAPAAQAGDMVSILPFEPGM